MLADNKWFTRLVVAAAIVHVLARLDPKLRRLAPIALAELEKARQALLAEGTLRFLPDSRFR